MRKAGGNTYLLISLGSLWLLFALPTFAGEVDWPAVVQKPYEHLKAPDLGLRPLNTATKAEWDRDRQRIKKAWQERLGTAPPTPNRLDIKIEKTEKLDGYTRQLLSFHSEGDDRIAAYLLTPANLKEREKRPAVVVFHQTTRDTLKEPAGLGKKPELALALQLVKRGYVTLSPECYILKDPKGWAHGQANILGKHHPVWTGMGKMTFDASRCVDFLETLPAVDKDRIGCIGHSLGAKEVLYAMAFDPRYRVGVFNEGGIGLRMSNWTDPWYLTEKMKPHIPAMEHHQVMALIAPRPFLVVGGGDADNDTSWAFVKAVLPVYELLGVRDRIGFFNRKGKHSFPKAGRRVAYRWLDHWLKFTPTKDES